MSSNSVKTETRRSGLTRLAVVDAAVPAPPPPITIRRSLISAPPSFVLRAQPFSALNTRVSRSPPRVEVTAPRGPDPRAAHGAGRERGARLGAPPSPAGALRTELRRTARRHRPRGRSGGRRARAPAARRGDGARRR